MCIYIHTHTYLITKLDQIIAVEEKIVVGVELPELAIEYVKVLVGKVVQHLVSVFFFHLVSVVI